MSKAILEFDLTDSDDAREHLRCVKSLDMALALWDIRIKLHGACLDYAERKKAPEAFYEGIELVFNEISEIFDKNKIDIDDLII